MRNIQELHEFDGELLACNPEWFKGDGFQTSLIGHGISPHWVSFHRGPEPPEKFNDSTYWICGEIVRKWSGKQWEITGRLKL